MTIVTRENGVLSEVRTRGFRYLLPWRQANYGRVSAPVADISIRKQLEWMTHEPTI